LSAAPGNARPEVRDKADVVTKAFGGHGAVRELVELILSGNTPPH
jgi:3-deoxy-D-manno-octulosonate 8-phosphate phosphatase KdsC-like HAD superfamily phosphatase